MRTIVTRCPHCSAVQLAEQRLIGLLVTCAKCDEDFLCTKLLGPVLWAREPKGSVPQGGFEKLISKVLFSYGIAVPLSAQQCVLTHMGREMSEGSIRDAVLHLNGNPYSVKLAFFRNKRGEPALHFKWSSSDAIALTLKSILPTEYEHYIVRKSADMLVGHSVVVLPGTKPAHFVLETEMCKNEGAAPTQGGGNAGGVLNGKDIDALLSELLRG